MKIILIILLLLLWPSAASADDWPLPRQNEYNHNLSIEEPVWPYAPAGELPNQYIDPIASGDIVVTAQTDWQGQKLVGYRLSDQSKIWEYRLNSYYPKQPIIYNGTIYFGIFTKPIVFAISLTTGVERWRLTLPGESSGIKFSPSPIEDGLLVASRALHYLKISDGQPIWKAQYDLEYPLASDGQSAYFRTHDLKLYKLRPADGLPLWQFNTGSTAGTAPLIVGNNAYFGTYQKVMSVDTRTGIKNWEYDLGPTAPLVGDLAISQDLLLVGANNGSITGFNANGSVRWQNRFNTDSNNGNGWQPGFIAAGSLAIAQASPTDHIVIDTTSGETRYRAPLTTSAAAPRAAAGQHLLTRSATAIQLLKPTNWLISTLPNRPYNTKTDPVIVIPGIMGSWPIDGSWRLDPLLGSFEPLLAALRQAGYIDGQTLFTFPYDWHADNSMTADLLADKIKTIRLQTNSAKVDLVAHSMGGLVARRYITGPNYQNDVDQVISLASPHRGAVKAYLTWEGGETGDGPVDAIKERLLGYESQKKGYTKVVSYIREKIPSMRQLLPIFDYLIRDNQVLVYQPCSESLHPCNDWLNSLGELNDLFLARVRGYNIIANLPVNQTLTYLAIGQTGTGDSWPHGQPSRKDYGSGDGTVLIHSARLIGNEEIVINADHTNVLQKAAGLVVAKLTGQAITLDTPKIADRYLFIRLFKSAKIMLTDQLGRRVGYDSAGKAEVNEIAGATYENSTDGSFVLIPQTSGADYKLSVSAETAQNYKVEASLIGQTASQDKKIEMQTDPDGQGKIDFSICPSSQTSITSFQPVI